ncbi:ankyrin repeat-containing domain protein [Trichophaea hybrida]|nr:ankyrin repeat-containing domain protein [Trichophaea hybrida]
MGNFFVLNLPNELFADVIDNLVSSIGIYKAFRLRTVNKQFNDAILHSIFDQSTDWHIDCNNPLRGRVSFMSTPLVARLLFAQTKLNPRRRPVLSAICRAAKALSVHGQQTDQQRLENTRAVCEAVALHLSAPDVLSLLAGSSPHSFSDAGDIQIAFSAAIIHGNIPEIHTLLAKGADVNYNVNHTYFSRPLQLATAQGRLDVVQILLDHGVDVHALAGVNADYMPYKSDAKAIRLVSYLSSNGSALRVACLAGHGHIVHALLQPRYGIATSGLEYEAAIMAATRGGHADLVVLLISKTGQPLASHLRQEIFWEASYHGREAIVRMMLIDHGVNVNSTRSEDRLSALQLATMGNRADVMRLLLDNGARDFDMSYRKGTPLLIAAERGHEEAVQVLIDYGADINLPSRHQHALEMAAIASQTHMLRLLLRNGADINAPSFIQIFTVGESALYFAIREGFQPAVRVLVEAGVPLSSTMIDKTRITRSPNLEGVVKTLLEIGAFTAESLHKARAENIVEPCSEPGLDTAEQERLARKKWEDSNWTGKY